MAAWARGFICQQLRLYPRGPGGIQRWPADYVDNPREYFLKAVTTVLDVQTRVSDLYSHPFADSDRAIKLSKNITTYQARIAKGVLGADMEVASELQAIGSALADIKLEALSHVGGAAAAIDREKVQQEARDDFLKEIVAILEAELSTVCFAEVREVLLANFGENDA